MDLPYDATNSDLDDLTASPASAAGRLMAGDGPPTVEVTQGNPVDGQAPRRSAHGGAYVPAAVPEPTA